MAAKIKEGLRDITQGVVERLKGGPKYADNLLGESLQDQLRKATAKELVGPSEELTVQVVDTINEDNRNGKDSKEIVGLLKKRLRTDNPHKQWLAVVLVGRVMRDCAAALGSHQEELLQEVARVMARPARQDSSAGKKTRQAAKDLLRSYGRAGTSAFRAVNRSTLESGSNAEHYTAAINAAVARESAEVVAEVNALIEQAQANTELLSEMLVAEQNGAAAAAAGTSGGGGAGDEFENELTRELVTEVRELRGLFDAYLEQMQSMSDPEVEAVMIRALEAVDMLDGALALQKDVASNQRELEQQVAAAGGGGGAAAAGAAGAAAGGAGRSRADDLISLDDLAEALMPQPPPVPAVAHPATTAAAEVAATTRPSPIDPFAALDSVAVQAALSPSSSQPQPPTHPAQPPVASQPPYTSPYGGYPQQQPQPYAAYPHHPQQQQPYGVYGATAGAPYGGVPPPAAAAGNPFANAAAVPTMSFGAAPPLLAAAMPAASGGNPFEAAAGVSVGGNPFAAGLPPAAPSSGSNSAAMDSEWAMFFANRATGQQPQ